VSVRADQVIGWLAAAQVEQSFHVVVELADGLLDPLGLGRERPDVELPLHEAGQRPGHAVCLARNKNSPASRSSTT
jgi:hypothetical protein